MPEYLHHASLRALHGEPATSTKRYIKYYAGVIEDMISTLPEGTPQERWEAYKQGQHHLALCINALFEAMPSDADLPEELVDEIKGTIAKLQGYTTDGFNEVATRREINREAECARKHIETQHKIDMIRQSFVRVEDMVRVFASIFSHLEILTDLDTRRTLAQRIKADFNRITMGVVKPLEVIVDMAKGKRKRKK